MNFLSKLLNAGKTAEKVMSGVGAQINPFDGGQDYSSVMHDRKVAAPNADQRPGRPVQHYGSLSQLMNLASPLQFLTPDVEIPTKVQSNNSTIFNGGMRFNNGPVVGSPLPDEGIYANTPDGSAFSKQDVLGQTYGGNPVYSPVLRMPKKYFSQPPGVSVI